MITKKEWQEKEYCYICEALQKAIEIIERVNVERMRGALARASQLTRGYESKSDMVGGDIVFIGYDQFDDVATAIYKDIMEGYEKDD